MSNDDVNVPLDATAMQAEGIIRAAIAWAWTLPSQQAEKLNGAEWDLMKALREYGDEFKGVTSK